jgi:membrane dipeptidase
LLKKVVWQVNAPGKFDFRLTDAQEKRAAVLHADAIVFDMMCENAGGNIFDHYPTDLQAEFRESMRGAGTGLSACIAAEYWPFEMSKLGRSDLLPQWLRAGGVTCGTYIIGVYEGDDPQWRKWEATVERYRNLPWLRYVTSAGEIRQAKRDGLIAYYAHCQPVWPAPRALKAFDIAYAKGLRSFMLTYNRMDNIGVGCTERVDAGLSMYGLEVVDHCNAIGMMVDVSHCGPQTTLDDCRHSKRPVNANHSSASGRHPHPRAKSDEALRAIADTGGIIGVYAVPTFLTADPEPTIEHMLDHIDYIADLVGWRHVGIGTDWPLQAPDDVVLSTFGADPQLAFRPAEGDRPADIDLTKKLDGFDDGRDLPNITRGLVKRGYSDEQIKGIVGENALRVFEDVCG